jgi:hypothetical protein
MSSDDPVVPRVAVGRWVWAVVALVLALGGVAVRGEMVIDLQGANAAVNLNLEFSPGSGPSNGAIDAILDPTVDLSAFVHVKTDPSNTGFGEGAAYQDQFGINAIYVDSRQAMADGYKFVGKAGSFYSAIAKHRGATLGQTIDLFEFEINSGEARIRNFASLTDSADPNLPAAYVEAAITLTENHGTDKQWRLFAGIDTDGTNPILVNGPGYDRDQLNVNVHPTLALAWDGPDVVVRIPQIKGVYAMSGVTELGIKYEMFAGVNLKGLGSGGVAGITDPFALDSPGSPAVELGDQFGKDGVILKVNGQPLSAYTVVPEPQALVLLAVALALVALRRWRPAA